MPKRQVTHMCNTSHVRFHMFTHMLSLQVRLGAEYAR